MRIDSNQSSKAITESQRSDSRVPAKSPGASPDVSPLGEDQAQLSGIHLQIQALVALTTQLPESSPEKVSALRQAIAGGSYQPIPEQVAGAVLENLALNRAA